MSYVPTDVLDQRQSELQVIKDSIETAVEDNFDLFDDFANFNLNLNVKTIESQSNDQGQSEETSKKQNEVERLPVLEGIRKYADKHILLVGRPGSGKSTALERLLLHEAEIAKRNPRTKIPVIVRLRECRTSIIDLIQFSLESCKLRLDISTVQDLLSKGKFLLLLDGINELPSAISKGDLAEFRKRYQHCTPMIFTTRSLSAANSLGIEKQLEMQPLSEMQMQQFTCMYLGDEKGSRLIRQLGSRLREFGETPLLLWMLCGVYEKVGKIPATLGSTFRFFTSIYDKQKGFDDKKRSWQSRFLQYLAFGMMPQNNPKGLKLSILKSEAENLLVKILELGKETNPLSQAIDYLDDLLKYHLIQFKSNDEIEFKHQLFQEFYAAEFLLRELHNLSDLELQKLYLNCLDWTESLALMVQLVEDEAQAIRVVKQALIVDPQLGAKLAGSVKLEFQEKTVGLVRELKLPKWFKTKLLGATRSDYIVTELLQDLNDRNSSICVDAAKALGEIGNKQAIEALVQALNNYYYYDNLEAAAKALGEIGDSQAVIGLLSVLDTHYDSATYISSALVGSETAAVKVLESIGVEALKTVGVNYSIKGLVQALCDESIWKSAATVLSSISGEKVIEEILHTSPNTHFLFWHIVQAIHDDSDHLVQMPLQALSNQNAEIRCRAAAILSKVGGDQAIKNLLSTLNNDKAFEVRWAAALALVHRKMNDEQVINFFSHILDEDGEFRYAAAHFLGEVGGKQSAQRLLKALDHEDSELRRYAISSLGEIGDEQILLSALENRNPDVRSQSAKLLGKIGNQQSVNSLLNVLKYDSDPEVREAAACAVGEIGNAVGEIGSIEATEDLLRVLLTVRSFYIRRDFVAILSSSKKARVAEVSLRMLSHAQTTTNQKECAAEILSILKDERAVSGLSYALRQSTPQLVGTATNALGEIGNQEAIAELLLVLQDEKFSPSRRGHIAKVLGSIGNDQAVNGLLHILREDKETFMRSEAAIALGETDNEEAIRGLLHALHDSALRVRLSVVQALRKIGSRQPKSIKTFDSQRIAEELLHALDRELGEDSESGKIVIFSENSFGWSKKEVNEDVCRPRDNYEKAQEIREQIIGALGEIGDEKVVDNLFSFLNNESVPHWSSKNLSKVAVESLGTIASSQTMSSLSKLIPESEDDFLLYTLTGIQAQCRIYNYEISQTNLPVDTSDNAFSQVINIYGGVFRDFVAGNKSIEVAGNYIETPHTHNP